MPSKRTTFTPSSILFRPRQNPPTRCEGGGLWWRRRALPPGPKGLLRSPFIAIAGLRRHPEYRCAAAREGRDRHGTVRHARTFCYKSVPHVRHADRFRARAAARHFARRTVPRLRQNLRHRLRDDPALGAADDRRRKAMDDGGGVQRDLFARAIPARTERRQPVGGVRLAHRRRPGRDRSARRIARAARR